MVRCREMKLKIYNQIRSSDKGKNKITFIHISKSRLTKLLVVVIKHKKEKIKSLKEKYEMNFRRHFLHNTFKRKKKFYNSVYYK